MSTFWGSGSNKSKLQQLIRQILLEKQDIVPSKHIVVSAIGVTGKTQMQKSTMVVNGIERREPELDVSIEEADLIMRVHIKNAAQNGIKRSVVESNDTYWCS